MMQVECVLGKPPNDPAHFVERPPELELSVACHGLAPGGLERSVIDTLRSLYGHESYYCRVRLRAYILSNRTGELDSSDLTGVIVPLGGVKDRDTQLSMIVADLEGRDRRLFTHGLSLRDLRYLWSFGVTTVPVIHNASPTWTADVKEFDHSLCPGFVAVSEAIRNELRLMGWKRSIQVIRHDLQRWYTLQELSVERARVRYQHAISPNTFLIGMVGHFKAHKAYTRAVRVLRELYDKVPRAHLLIIGSWSEKFGCSTESYYAVCDLALRLGVLHRITCVGPLSDSDAYYPAFDAFLNTSVYEGVSLATMQALRAGCPVVSSDAGGQAEIVRGRGALIPSQSGPGAYAVALHRLYRHRKATEREPEPRIESLAVPRLWPLLGAYAFDRKLRGNPEGGVLFITDNLSHGGPQRSLLNLLTAMPEHSGDHLLLLEGNASPLFHAQLQSSVPRWSTLPVGLEPCGQLSAILHLMRSREFATLCFWNVNARLKMLLAKMMLSSDVFIVDVSPGPMLFDELDRNQEYARKISTSVPSYIRRLDCFVAKYQDGLIPARYRATARTSAVIPNGVNEPVLDGSAPDLQFRPQQFDAEFAIVTTGRIVPNKRIEFLLESIAIAKQKIPNISLTIAGGADSRHTDYFKFVQQRVRTLNLSDNVVFLGPHPEIVHKLHEFRAFFMVSHWQGCPNASLEAMMSGLPVVANDDGGTKEQVVDGETGLLIGGEDPQEAAGALSTLLSDPVQARVMGRQARERARSKFSMTKMVERYQAVLRHKFTSEVIYVDDSSVSSFQ